MSARKRDRDVVEAEELIRIFESEIEGVLKKVDPKDQDEVSKKARVLFSEVAQKDQRVSVRKERVAVVGLAGQLATKKKELDGVKDLVKQKASAYAALKAEKEYPVDVASSAKGKAALNKKEDLESLQKMLNLEAVKAFPSILDEGLQGLSKLSKGDDRLARQCEKASHFLSLETIE